MPKYDHTFILSVCTLYHHHQLKTFLTFLYLYIYGYILYYYWYEKKKLKWNVKRGKVLNLLCLMAWPSHGNVMLEEKGACFSYAIYLVRSPRWARLICEDIRHTTGCNGHKEINTTKLSSPFYHDTIRERIILLCMRSFMPFACEVITCIFFRQIIKGVFKLYYFPKDVPKFQNAQKAY